VSATAAQYSAAKVQSLMADDASSNSSIGAILLQNSDFARFSWTLLAKDPNLTDAFRQSFTIPPDTMLLFCMYNLGFCNYTNFSYYFDINYGKNKNSMSISNKRPNKTHFYRHFCVL
jgi:hypothetical protein